MKSQNERVINYSRNRSTIHVKTENIALTHSKIDFETRDYDQAINGNQNSSYLHGPWRETILSRGPFTHFLTLTYSHEYSDHIAIESVRKLIEHINRDIFGSKSEERARYYRCGDCGAAQGKSGFSRSTPFSYLAANVTHPVEP